MLYTPQQRRRCNTAKLDNQTSLLPLSTCLCLVRFRTRAFASGVRCERLAIVDRCTPGPPQGLLQHNRVSVEYAVQDIQFEMQSHCRQHVGGTSVPR
jgi:hypothetical protein